MGQHQALAGSAASWVEYFVVENVAAIIRFHGGYTPFCGGCTCTHFFGKFPGGSITFSLQLELCWVELGCDKKANSGFKMERGEGVY